MLKKKEMVKYTNCTFWYCSTKLKYRYKKWFLCLAGLIALTAIGSSIFLYMKMNELSDKLALNEVSKEESVSTSVPDPVEQSSRTRSPSNSSKGSAAKVNGLSMTT